MFWKVFAIVVLLVVVVGCGGFAWQLANQPNQQAPSLWNRILSFLPTTKDAAPVVPPVAVPAVVPPVPAVLPTPSPAERQTTGEAIRTQVWSYAVGFILVVCGFCACSWLWREGWNYGFVAGWNAAIDAIEAVKGR